MLLKIVNVRRQPGSNTSLACLLVEAAVKDVSQRSLEWPEELKDTLPMSILDDTESCILPFIGNHDELVKSKARLSDIHCGRRRKLSD